MDSKLVEGMHGGMQLDVALGAVHSSLPGCRSHVDAIGQAGHLLRPIPAHRSCHTHRCISCARLLFDEQVTLRACTYACFALRSSSNA